MPDAADELGAAIRKSNALRRIVAVTRRYPDIWDRGPGAYSSYPEVVSMWRAVEVALEDARPHRRDEFAAWLIGTAREFPAEEDGRLAAAWAYVTGSEEWARLPRSARNLYEALHAVAAEQGRLGGPRVEMCHTLAIKLIHARTGLRPCSKGTITNAREALVRAGFIEARVGEPWAPGIKSRAARYDLLPAAVRERRTELSQSARFGIVQSADSRPGLPARERELVLRTIADLHEERRQQETGQQEQEQRDPAAEFGHLLEPPEPGIRHVRAADSAGMLDGGSAAAADTDFSEEMLGGAGDGDRRTRRYGDAAAGGG